jgi:hypothetical protein
MLYSAYRLKVLGFGGVKKGGYIIENPRVGGSIPSPGTNYHT